MLKICALIGACLLLLGSTIYGQQYSTLFPEDTMLLENYVLCDGLQASNGEYVGIGVRQTATPQMEACFFRLDDDGDLMGAVQLTGFTVPGFVETAFITPFDEEYKSLAQITEIFNTAGVSQGYFLSMTTLSQSFGLGILLARVDHAGVLQAYKFIPSEKADMRSVDCLQREDNQRMVVLATYKDITDPTVDVPQDIFFIEADPMTCTPVVQAICNAGIQTSQFPYKMAQQKVGNNTQFFVVSRVDSANVHHLGTTLFSSNYSVLPYAKGKLDMKPNSTVEIPYPTGLVLQNNNTAYVSGYYDLNNGSDIVEGFLFKATFSPPIPFPIISWADLVPTSGLFNLGLDFVDLQFASDGNLLALGSTNGFSGGIRTTTLMKFSTTGGFLWGRRPQGTLGAGAYPRQLPVVLDATADGGAWVGSTFLANSNGAARIFAMKTDPGGWLNNLDCIASYTPVIQSLVPPVLPHSPFSRLTSEPLLGIDPIPSSLSLLQTFCDQFNPINCAVTFTSQPIPPCNGFILQADPVSGTGPFTYSWDFFCDNSTDATGDNVTIPSFPPGIHPFCVTMTDATGCTATFMAPVQVFPDMTPPTIQCPSDITLSTNTPDCTANFSPVVTATDNCGPVTVLCDPQLTVFNLGASTVICQATDQSGNTATCFFTVTVVDNTPPEINCPPSPPVVQIASCIGQAPVIFGTATATDECTAVTIVGSHVSGSNFPCGTTTVAFSALDVAGNLASCNILVKVQCLCGETSLADIECTSDPRIFTFIQTVENLTGSTGACDLTVSTTQPGVVIVGNPPTWSGNIGTVTGMITVATGCIPVNFFSTVTLTCQCPNGQVSCSLPFTLDVPCCYELQVNDAEVCENAAQFNVPLLGCAALPDIQQVRWYVTYAPCPPIGDPAWGSPYQVTNGCDDLVLLPKYLTGNVCVYAEVLQGTCGGSCWQIFSNVATVTLCKPAACSITATSPSQLCSNAVPSIVTMTANYVDNCVSSIQWYNDAGILQGQTNNTMIATGLSFAGAPNAGPDNCWREYHYTAVISQSCGDIPCQYSIRIYDNDADAGTLTLLPPDVPPLCPGEDAQILYTPECAALPSGSPLWHWHVSTNGSSYTPVTTAGNMNPLFNTNKLDQDTWYKVTKNNGVCPADEVILKIDVYDALEISALKATPLDYCVETGVELQVDILKASSCGVRIEWFKDGNLIHNSFGAAGALSVYDYIDASLLGDYSGNYYVVVTDNCCEDQIKKSNVETIGPPVQAVVLGPCFRCKGEIVTLEAVNINQPSGSTCTYNWYKFEPSSSTWILIGGENSATLSVIWPETKYKVVTDCGGCVKEVEFEFEQCGIFTDTEEPKVKLLQVMPNPTTGKFSVFMPETSTETTLIRIADTQGRTVLSLGMQAGLSDQLLDLSQLPSGIYFIQLWLNGQLTGIAKVVKE